MTSFGQLSLGGHTSFLKVFGGSTLKHFGLGINADFAPSSDKLVFTGDLNYYLPNSFTDYTYAYSFEQEGLGGPVETIEIDYIEKVSFFNLNAGVKYYLIGDWEDNFGLYGLGQLGLFMAPYKTEIGEFDETTYYTNTSESREILSSLTINVGIGFDVDLDFGYLFANTKLNLPANTVNGNAVEFAIPATFAAHLGMRFPF